MFVKYFVQFQYFSISFQVANKIAAINSQRVFKAPLCCFSAERFEYARKLKQAMEELRRAGERLGKFELEKRQAISMEHFGKAKLKKAQMDDYREQVYSFLEIPVLLELNGVSAKQTQISPALYLLVALGQGVSVH